MYFTYFLISEYPTEGRGKINAALVSQPEKVLKFNNVTETVSFV